MIARRTAIGVVVVAGLAASIATSGYAVATKETPEFAVAVADRAEPYEQAVRFCPVWGFTSYYGEEPAPTTIFEVSAELRDAQAGSVSISVALDDGIHASSGVLAAPGSENLTLQITAPSGGWGECSPWARVTIGPLVPRQAIGVVRWRMAVTSDVDTAGIAMPWDEPHGHLELEPER